MPPPINAARANEPRRDEHDLQTRIRGEFREMPGLTLTLAQATRLFSVDPARCEGVLVTLVEVGVLSTDGRTFARADAGRRSL
jgi:hypothetical protein